MPSIGSSASTVTCCKTFSHYLARQLQADSTAEARLLNEASQAIDTDFFLRFADWSTLGTADTLAPALRKLRQAVMMRLIVRDLGGQASLDEVVRTMSDLARFCLQTALPVACASLQQHGQPIGDESGSEQALIVIGMGKLGGNELNVSSDIDLIFVYPEDGQTNGARPISNHEFFCQVGKRLIALIHDITPEGQVFRVDMRLRPYGDAGPLAVSFNALENYLLTQGREWERYAWIKARPLTGDGEALAQFVRPFVYRKYLDYGAYGAMRDLSSQIQREVRRRDLAGNIKLGQGGIREIEFIAQVFQLIRGGREKSLQLRGTRETLQRLKSLRLLEPEAVDTLDAAYVFLRQLEHRLQYIDDQQTQTLPSGDAALAQIANSMDFADAEHFMQALQQHQRHVTRHFEQVFFLPADNAPDHPLSPLWQDSTQADLQPALQQLGYQAPAEVARLLRALATSQRYLQMPLANRKKLDGLIPPLIEVASQFANPDQTLSRILGLLEAISRRASYLALLTEYPQTLQRLASLSSASAWISSYLTRHPILLDELLDARVLYGTPDWSQLAAQLAQQLQDCGADVESKLDTLRHFQHAQVFRLLAQDLAGMWTVEALADELSALADLILSATLRHAWLDIASRHREVPRFAIIGYGKLGGKELGHASDLDLIFLYDDPHPEAPELYSRLARKMVLWLTSTTAAGGLYDIDLRLRPNGDSGLLVSAVAAFENYQQHQAWVWEHQALTRARPLAGDPAIAQAFQATRTRILSAERDITDLTDNVRNMRLRMLESHPARPEDVKHARGGLVDIEFIVQFLILAHARQHPALAANTGTISLLGEAARQGLIPQDLAENARQAYRFLRRQQHRARLNAQETCSISPELEQHYQQASALWQYLFDKQDFPKYTLGK